MTTVTITKEQLVHAMNHIWIKGVLWRGKNDEQPPLSAMIYHYFNDESVPIRTHQSKNDFIDKWADAVIAKLTPVNQTAALQAKIDALMLEHCPEEMTPEQLANWESHQKLVSIAEFENQHGKFWK